MRVSNLHHETALPQLLAVQEIEPDTWEALVDRLEGVHSVKHLQDDAITAPKDFPPMFSGWAEYRDYLLQNLITKPEQRQIFADKFRKMDERYHDMESKEYMYRVQVAALIVNDYHLTKIVNWENFREVVMWRAWKAGRKQPWAHNKYIHGPKSKSK